ncbi:MAG: helix-turn-helix domain-containing protein, partial [Desulfovibrionaceae bacterium]|nr:helix-turn-helix domain-containing protein [Desulfovibrionaceae bacterium]
MSAKSTALTKIVGANIMNRRKRRNLTQEKLAEMVGIGQQSLSRMEQGHIAPRFERLQGFANALGCSVADLFQQEDDGTQQASVDD